MKHIYVAPETTVIEMETESLMLTVSAEGGEGGLEGTGNGGWGSDMEADANGRRGSWGNLWESESKSRW